MEIRSISDAEERLAAIFGTKIQNANQYAEILYFLSTKRRFAQALEAVSADLWRVYTADQGPDDINAHSNRFTRAIVRYAQEYGFAIPEHVVFGGPLPGPVFLGHVRLGILWKDSFAPEHGEFSHTFQWFAIGKHFGMGTRAVDLFKGTASFSKVKVWNRTAASSPEQTIIPLWSYVADCFPFNKFSNSKFGLKDTSFSSTFRCPNVVHAFTLAQREWFIRAYLLHRQIKLAAQVDSFRNSLKTRDDRKRYASDMKAIGKVTEQTHSSDKGWEMQQNVYTRGFGYGQPAPPTSSGSEVRIWPKGHKTGLPARFHGRDGYLPAAFGKTLGVPSLSPDVSLDW